MAFSSKYLTKSDCSVINRNLAILQAAKKACSHDDDDFFIFTLSSQESAKGATNRTNPDLLRSCLCLRVFRFSFASDFLNCCLLDSIKHR